MARNKFNVVELCRKSDVESKSCLVLSCLVLSCLALSCLVYCCHVLRCVVCLLSLVCLVCAMCLVCLMCAMCLVCLVSFVSCVLCLVTKTYCLTPPLPSLTLGSVTLCYLTSWTVTKTPATSKLAPSVPLLPPH